MGKRRPVLEVATLLESPIPVRTITQIQAEVEAERQLPEAKNYEVGRFFRPSVTVDVVIFTLQERELRVLLVRRGQWPFQDRWALPGGFVREAEGLEAAAARELLEETGVKDVFLEQLHTFGGLERDPRTRVITVAYYALVPNQRLTPAANADAREARWCSVYHLPELAFDHDLILARALTRLRAKIMNSRVAFQLMPEKFTLTQLQQAYEVVLGKELDKRNFRKKILASDVVLETDEKQKKGRQRPARLYRFNEAIELED
ncbi:MAG: NUDIX hydrolase [Candidatus Eremiobacteraeota bacterium]|nr:NUDIX hydrolase [Candidatus Eremiobacteraeota bacterium]